MKEYRATVHGGWPIFFGEDARDLLLEETEKVNPDKVYIVTDRTVDALYGEEIRENIPHAFDSETVVFNEGEGNKNLATLEHVAGDLLRAGINDRSLVLNVGGGVVLNLGGLAASVLGHGIRFAHVATTFLAQSQVVNSNRQGIHFVGGLNQLKVYRAPRFAIVDPHFLESETPRQLRADFVEYARDALIVGGDLHAKAMAALSAAGDLSEPRLSALLEAALQQSLNVAGLDPSEEGNWIRESYGQPIGRALESLSDGRLLEAEARYFGMRIAGAAAHVRGLMSVSDFERHEAVLKRVGIETKFPDHVRTDRLIYKLHGNNKTQLDGLKFLLLEGIGRLAAPTNAASGPWVELNDNEVARAIDWVRNA